jgi:type VI secretion system protein ImpM
MSEQMNGNTPHCGWYGKLPCTGDFVGRGLSHDIQARVEEWIGSGLIQLRHRLPDWQVLFSESPIWSFVLPRDVLAAEPLLGCIAPSADRVGRRFPLVALRSLSSLLSIDPDMPPHGRWHSATAELMVDGLEDAMSVDAFDAEFTRLGALRNHVAPARSMALSEQTARGEIYAVLGDATDPLREPLAAPALAETSLQFSWPELLTLFDPAGSRSFWWTLGGGSVSRRLAHDGILTSHLFITLFTQGMPAFGAVNRA